jgi:hypothetical protein
VIELSRYVFETLREDEEFAFCRGQRDDGEGPTMLSVAPVSEHPGPGILERLSTKIPFGLSLIQSGRLDLSPWFVVRVGQCLYSRIPAASHSIGSWGNPWN